MWRSLSCLNLSCVVSVSIYCRVWRPSLCLNLLSCVEAFVVSKSTVVCGGLCCVSIYCRVWKFLSCLKLLSQASGMSQSTVVCGGLHRASIHSSCVVSVVSQSTVVGLHRVSIYCHRPPLCLNLLSCLEASVVFKSTVVCGGFCCVSIYCRVREFPLCLNLLSQA